MKTAVTAAVLLAVVSTAVVTVCQHSETRHLQYRVWKLERRRELLERDRRRLESAIEAARTPRRLLHAADPALPALAGEEAPRARPEAHVSSPEGFRTGDHFEGGER